MACGPCMAATMRGRVTKGPTPIMSTMLSAVAGHRVRPRSKFWLEPGPGLELGPELAAPGWGVDCMASNISRARVQTQAGARTPGSHGSQALPSPGGLHLHSLHLDSLHLDSKSRAIARC